MTQVLNVDQTPDPCKDERGEIGEAKQSSSGKAGVCDTHRDRFKAVLFYSFQQVSKPEVGKVKDPHRAMISHSESKLMEFPGEEPIPSHPDVGRKLQGLKDFPPDQQIAGHKVGGLPVLVAQEFPKFM